MVLAAHKRDTPCKLLFPPLKPRYAMLLQAASAHFGAGVKVLSQGWGDQRCWLAEALVEAQLPIIRFADFRLPDKDAVLLPRLSEVAVASQPLEISMPPAAE